MSPLGWLDVSQIDFKALLLLEPLHAQYLAQDKPNTSMGTALKAHPEVGWYLVQLYPPAADYVDACLAMAQADPSAEDIRQAELSLLDGMQDWLIYLLDPAKYDQLEFLNWDDTSLLSMADFEDKIVLDIGSGTGRLAFAVAPHAKVVYAIEPVANLRRYLYEKRMRLGINNLYPLDGTLIQIPFEDSFADILMAGHVFGDDFDREYSEMRRVVRHGGMILLHPGTNAEKDDEAHHYLLTKGFDFGTFEEPGDGMKRKYWKTVDKENDERNNDNVEE